MYNIMFVKERFTPVYLDSENYYKQSPNKVETQNVNGFARTEQPYNGQFQTGYNNPYTSQWNQADTYYPVSGPDNVTQQEDIKKNSLYTNQHINGVPLKDYYEKYTKDVLEN